MQIFGIFRIFEIFEQSTWFEPRLSNQSYFRRSIRWIDDWFHSSCDGCLPTVRQYSVRPVRPLSDWTWTTDVRLGAWIFWNLRSFVVNEIGNVASYLECWTGYIDVGGIIMLVMPLWCRQIKDVGEIIIMFAIF